MLRLLLMENVVMNVIAILLFPRGLKNISRIRNNERDAAFMNAEFICKLTIYGRTYYIYKNENGYWHQEDITPRPNINIYDSIGDAINAIKPTEYETALDAALALTRAFKERK
jgi:hypothetical protein